MLNAKYVVLPGCAKLLRLLSDHNDNNYDEDHDDDNEP